MHDLQALILNQNQKQNEIILFSVNESKNRISTKAYGFSCIFHSDLIYIETKHFYMFILLRLSSVGACAYLCSLYEIY